MYIEPNYSVLKKITLTSTLVLALVFGGTFVWSFTQTEPEQPKTTGLSGVLTKEDGIFLIDKQMVVQSTEPLDGLIGQTVAVVGKLSSEGILDIEQLVVAPEKRVEIEVEPTFANRATSQSNNAISFWYPELWEVQDTSTNNQARIILTKEGQRIIVERFDHETYEPVQYAEIEANNVLIDGWSFSSKRIIPQGKERLAEILEPSLSCLNNNACPVVQVFNESITPESSEAFNQVIASLSMLPKPAGWRVYRIVPEFSDWNMEFLYPDEITMQVNGQGYQALKNNVAEFDIDIHDTVSDEKDTLGGQPDLKKQNVELPTRSETLFTLPNGSKKMILITPDETGEIHITGSGPIFEAVIRTIVFEEK